MFILRTNYNLRSIIYSSKLIIKKLNNWLVNVLNKEIKDIKFNSFLCDKRTMVALNQD